MTRRNSSGSILSNGAKTDVNASLIHTSIAPTSDSIFSAIANMASASATSTDIGTALAAGALHLAGSAVEPGLATREQGDGVAPSSGGHRAGPPDPTARPRHNHGSPHRLRPFLAVGHVSHPSAHRSRLSGSAPAVKSRSADISSYRRCVGIAANIGAIAFRRACVTLATIRRPDGVSVSFRVRRSDGSSSRLTSRFPTSRSHVRLALDSVIPVASASFAETHRSSACDDDKDPQLHQIDLRRYGGQRPHRDCHQ